MFSFILTAYRKARTAELRCVKYEKFTFTYLIFLSIDRLCISTFLWIKECIYSLRKTSHSLSLVIYFYAK